MKLSFSKVLMFFGVIISVALINGSARATDVSGVINTNTLWNLDGSPYCHRPSEYVVILTN